jgi:hypothetical protein
MADSRITAERQARTAVLRKLKNPIYDTGVIAAAATNIRIPFFQAPQGQPIAVAGALKTEADTNLLQSASLSEPSEFDLYGLQMSIVYDATGVAGAGANNAITDFANLYERGFVRFFFGSDKDWLGIPFTQVPSGSYIAGTVTTADDNVPTNYAFLGNGSGSCREMVDLTVGGQPIPIGAKETFGARLEWQGGAVTSVVAYRLRCYGIGVLYKGL